MQTSRNCLLRILILGAILVAPVRAQNQTGPRINAPAASPASTVKQRVGFTDVEVRAGYSDAPATAADTTVVFVARKVE